MPINTTININTRINTTINTTINIHTRINTTINTTINTHTRINTRINTSTNIQKHQHARQHASTRASTRASTSTQSSISAFLQVGQSAALIAGGTLIAAQALSHLGIVQVNWKKVEGLFTKFTDVDGDGDTDVDDALTAWQKAKHIMTSEMVPSAAGFSAGFAIGIIAL
ncbi:hypothetical protein AAMO2058_000445200 [Amorphochlora amoebiformis]